LAVSADTADRRETLIIGVEAAIGGAAKATAVKRAPGTIGMSRRADRSRDDQDAENAEPNFIVFPFAQISAEQRSIVN
jgi:hypothetical protein